LTKETALPSALQPVNTTVFCSASAMADSSFVSLGGMGGVVVCLVPGFFYREMHCF
jgi:hypothetical protein